MYVIISCNAEAFRTKTVHEAGEACKFDEKNENVMTFQNLHRMESLYIRAFDECVPSPTCLAVSW